jgi:hypothetical protein
MNRFLILPSRCSFLRSSGLALDREIEKQVLSYAVKPVEVKHYIYAPERLHL